MKGTLGKEAVAYDIGRVRDPDVVRATFAKTNGEGSLAVTILVDGVPTVAGESSADSKEGVDVRWLYQSR